jgi:hypothetical protein
LIMARAKSPSTFFEGRFVPPLFVSLMVFAP